MKCWLTDKDRQNGFFCRSFDCIPCREFKQSKKKLPENPFKETDKLAEKLTLDIADKTDKALIDSLNDLIKQGLLEVRVLEPQPVSGEPRFWIKSGVQVVPKFDEYTKKLESENSELKKKLSIIDFDYSSKLEKEIQTLKGKMVRIGQENQDLRKQLHQTLEDLSDEIFKHQGLQFRHECLQEKYTTLEKDIIQIEKNLDNCLEFRSSLKKFLKLGKE